MERSLPPLITTSAPGSFAWRTIVDRKPKIISQVLEENSLTPAQREALHALDREMRSGVVTDPIGGPGLPTEALQAEERAAWSSEIAANSGRSWLSIPWYFAEAFFYLKLLAACGYFSGARAGIDPFAPLKERELSVEHGGLSAARHLCAARAAMSREDGLRSGLLASLWGNRADLSNFEMDEASRRAVLARERESLVIDHTNAAASALGDAREVHVILDNSGPELVSDLLLALETLERGGSVVLHAKKMPFFVSDATAADVARTVEALAADAEESVRAFGATLAETRRAGRLRIEDHWFWSSPLHFPAMPPEVVRRLSDGDLVLIKGDANYRRLLSDRKWESGTSMEDIASYFPRPFIVLRTMKSEIVVDVPAAQAERLRAVDSEWLVNGRRGIVRLCRPLSARSRSSSASA